MKMTDRIRGLTVILENDYRIDEVEKWIIPTIEMIKGVAEVKPVVVEGTDYINRQAIKLELRESILKVLE